MVDSPRQPLGHLLDGLVHLTDHLLLDIGESGDMDQHGGVLHPLSAQSPDGAREGKGVNGFLERWRKDLLSMDNGNMFLVVLGRHPTTGFFC